jgi:uncharacterized membrane protein
MLYASLKAVHLLAVVVWVGGMAFTLYCLHPAAKLLDPASRVPLMHAVLRRFLAVVAVAAALIFVTGATMIGLAWSAAVRAGLAFNMPLDWYAMVALFFAMLAVFVHIRVALFRRLASAVAAARWPDGAAVLAAIRWEVTLNLVIGAFIIVIVRLGGTA